MDMGWQNTPQEGQQGQQPVNIPTAESIRQSQDRTQTPYVQAYPQQPVQPGVPQQAGWQQPSVSGPAVPQQQTGYTGYGPPVPPPAPMPPAQQGGYGPAGNPYYAPPQSGWPAPPYGQQQPAYGQQPGYGGYGGMPAAQPAPPPMDPTKPIIVMGSRRVSKEQYVRLCQPQNGLRAGLAVVLGLLVLIFSAIALVQGYGYGDMLAFGVNVGLIALSCVVMVVWLGVSQYRRKKRIDRAYACAVGTGSGDSIIELYIDRVVCTSPRGRSSIQLAYAELVEYADMLVLSGRGATVIWRAEDVTAMQYRSIQAVLYPQLRPGMRKVRGIFYPRALGPLPLPAVENTDEVRMVFRVEEEEPLGTVPLGKRYLAMLPAFLALMTIFSVYLANSAAITTSILMDVLIFALLCWGCGALLLLLVAAVWHGAAGKNHSSLPAAYALTRDGLARQWGDGTCFVPAADVQPVFKNSGVALDTPYGRMWIDWKDIPNRAACMSCLEGFGRARHTRKTTY